LMSNDERLFCARPKDIPARDVVVIPAPCEKGNVLGLIATSSSTFPFPSYGYGVTVGCTVETRKKKAEEYHL